VSNIHRPNSLLALAGPQGVNWSRRGSILLTTYQPHDFQDELDAIAAIPAVGTILEVTCRTTGMGFAAIARVTNDRWICCAVKDDIAFGLRPGSELQVETTICNEIRTSRQLVVIDHVAEDADFRTHHTPRLYGFQSYISQPIILPDGSFFGTLCAIDPRPNALNTPAVLGMFQLFADLVALHLDTYLRLMASERENARLHEQFRAGLGHDMRNVLAAMEAGTRLLQKTPLNDRAQLIVGEMQASTQKLSQQIAEAMQSDPEPRLVDRT
jgi:GAF domain-containing protein